MRKFMSAQERMPVWIMNAGWDIERHGRKQEKLSDNDFISLNETEQDRNKNYQMMMKFIGKKTALFFLSDMFAVEAIHYFQKQGVIIPDELGIAGFDGNILGKYCYPRLTTVYQDVTEKGKQL